MAIARQTTSVAHLGADRFASMLFPYPLPEEQERISHALQKYEKMVQCEEQYLEKLAKLKTGLMQDLLTGKVRVKIDKSEQISANV